MLNHDENQYRLCACTLGVAIGVAKGLFLMLLAWVGLVWGAGLPLVQHMGTFLQGYAPTLSGGLIGGAWGFAVGFVSGLVIGWVYNLCLCCGKFCGKFCGKKGCYGKTSHSKKEK